MYARLVGNRKSGVKVGTLTWKTPDFRFFIAHTHPTDLSKKMQQSECPKTGLSSYRFGMVIGGNNCAVNEKKQNLCVHKLEVGVAK